MRIAIEIVLALWTAESAWLAWRADHFIRTGE